MSISALEAQLEAQRAAAAQAVNELARQIAPATLKAQAAVVVLAGAGLVAATTALISLRLALRPLFK